LHRNSNITGNPISTFHNAGILNFWRLEYVDNQHCYSHKNTFTFTGKEKDAETEYSYFGARYYDSDLSGLFLSVDPLADKYPSISPYAYCAWNPVKLVDPDGSELMENDDKWQYNTSSGCLTWLNNEGGRTKQTVEMVHNQGEKCIVDQTVSFSGDITRMFDCSVISPTVDGMVDGGYNIASGVTEAGAGLAFGVGLIFGSGGTATPLGTAVGSTLVAIGSSNIILGTKNVLASLEGHPNTSMQHDFMKSVCKNTADFAISIVANGKSGFKNGFVSLVISSLWDFARYRRAEHPTYKGIPQGATITQ